MKSETIIEKNKTRIRVLEIIYDLADGNLSFEIKDHYELEKQLNENIDYTDLVSALIYCYQKEYITYIDYSTDGQPDMYGNICITAKGVEFIEKLRTGESTKDFEKDFNPQAINSFVITYNNVTNPQMAFGDHNSLVITPSNPEIDELINIIDTLIAKFEDNQDLNEIKDAVIEAKQKNKLTNGFLRTVGMIMKGLGQTALEIIKTTASMSLISALGL